MNSFNIRYFIAFFLCIFLVRTFLYADYADTMKSTWQSALVHLKKISDSTKETATQFGEQAQKFVNDLADVDLRKNISSALRKRSTVFQENVYAHDKALVRVGNELSDNERKYLLKRRPKVQAAVQKILQEDVKRNDIPTISIIISGGGYRAMLGALGFLAGTEKIGLLDATTYIAALSGSTWAVASWIATGMSLSDFKQYIVQQIKNDIVRVKPQESRMISSVLYAKILSRQLLTTVDLYGGLLANCLLADLGDRRQLIKLSDLSERIKNGDYPYAIYTAIDARMAVAHDAPWFEFTSDEIGCPDYAAYIPTWAYGRKFKEGHSVNFVPEQSLGFQLGTFGSAFGVHVQYAWDMIADALPNSWFKEFMIKFVKHNSGKRMFWAEIPNYMFGMKNQELSKRTDLKLVDAGLAFTLPYPPVSGQRPERKSDVLVFCDMSASGKAQAFMKCEEYARKRGLPFPKIDYKNLSNRTITVFKGDVNRSIPTIIYMPRFNDQELWNNNKKDSLLSSYNNVDNFDIERCIMQDFCNTANFQYSPEQSQQVMNLMEFNVVVNKEKILDAIRFAAERE